MSAGICAADEQILAGALNSCLSGYKRTVNPKITGDTGTVGVRISPHPIARQLVRLMGKPITATSANISGLSPAQSAQEVVEMLGDKVDYIVDGGQTAAGLCSTDSWSAKWQAFSHSPWSDRSV